MNQPLDGTRATIRRGRSSKGRATAVVTRRGSRPRLVGDDPVRLDELDTRAVAELDSLTLAMLADAWMRQEHPETPFPALLGAVEGESWHEVIRTPRGSADGYVEPGAEHWDGTPPPVERHVGIDGGFLPRLPRWMGAPVAAGTHEARLSWPTRMRIRRPAMRHGDPDVMVAADGKRARRYYDPQNPAAGTCDERGRLVSYGDGRRGAPTERVAIGHAWADRPRTVKAVRRSTARVQGAARATARAEHRSAIVASTDGSVLVDAATTAPVGEPVAVTLPGGTLVTFTAAPGKVTRYRWTRGDAGGSFTARTPVAAAMRLATLGV